MTSEGRAPEVFLVPIGDEGVLALPADDDEGSRASSDAADLSALIQAVGPLVAAVLRGRGAEGATYYELSPQSRKMLEDARLDRVGNYFRGVLRNPNGQTSHQVQLREVRSSAAPPRIDAASAAQIAQMAAIQVQLARIEDTLDDLTTSVESVTRLLETQQRARVEAALQLLRELHNRARATGAVSATDWHRLTGVELDLETQLRAVRAELSNRLSGRSFGNGPSADAKQMAKVRPERIADLVELHKMLLGGLRGWNELLLLHKFDADELTDGEVAAVMERLSRLESHRRELFGQIHSVAKSSKKSKPRSALQRLFTDGLILGGANDARKLGAVRSGRTVLEAVIKSGSSRLSRAAERKILLASPDDQVVGPD